MCLSSNESRDSEAFSSAFNFGVDVTLTEVDQCFQNDWDVFGDIGRYGLERFDSVLRDRIMAAGRIHLADMNLLETLGECLEQKRSFGHAWIHLPSVTD